MLESALLIDLPHHLYQLSQVMLTVASVSYIAALGMAVTLISTGVITEDYYDWFENEQRGQEAMYT